jgi:hypothetical protein
MLPKFKLIRPNDIIPLMESNEERVNFYKEQIEKSAFIRNPVSLAPAGRRKFMLLEDSSLLEAIRQMQIPLLPAQITSSLKSHQIEAYLYTDNSIDSGIAEFGCLFPRAVQNNRGRGAVDRKQIVRMIVEMQGQKEIILDLKRGGAGQLPLSLFHIFALFKKRGGPKMDVLPGQFRSAIVKSSTEFSRVRFQNFSFNDLVYAAMNRHLFPFGLLSFELNCRIIGINYPVSVLTEKASLKEKEQFLYDLINYRLRSGHPEFIRGGIYLISY